MSPARHRFSATNGEPFDTKKELIEYQKMHDENQNTRTYVYDMESGKGILCDTAEDAAKLLKTGKYCNTPADCKNSTPSIEDALDDGKEPEWLKINAKTLPRIPKTKLEEKMLYLKLEPTEEMKKSEMLKAIQVKIEADASSDDGV